MMFVNYKDFNANLLEAVVLLVSIVAPFFIYLYTESLLTTYLIGLSFWVLTHSAYSVKHVLKTDEDITLKDALEYLYFSFMFIVLWPIASFFYLVQALDTLCNEADKYIVFKARKKAE